MLEATDSVLDNAARLIGLALKLDWDMNSRMHLKAAQSMIVGRARYGGFEQRMAVNEWVLEQVALELREVGRGDDG